MYNPKYPKYLTKDIKYLQESRFVNNTLKCKMRCFWVVDQMNRQMRYWKVGFKSHLTHFCPQFVFSFSFISGITPSSDLKQTRWPVRPDTFSRISVIISISQTHRRRPQVSPSVLKFCPQWQNILAFYQWCWSLALFTADMMKVPTVSNRKNCKTLSFQFCLLNC